MPLLSPFLNQDRQDSIDLRQLLTQSRIELPHSGIPLQMIRDDDVLIKARIFDTTTAGLPLLGGCVCFRSFENLFSNST